MNTIADCKGCRILFKAEWDKSVIEATILEVSPSKQYALFHFADSDYSHKDLWLDISQYNYYLVEVLEDK